MPTHSIHSPSIHSTDSVSGEQYRYALTNFVRAFPCYNYLVADAPDTPISVRPSPIKRSRSSEGSSRSKNGRSHGFMTALLHSRALRPGKSPPMHPDAQQAGAPSMTFQSRYDTIHVAPPNNASLAYRTRHRSSSARSTAGRATCCASRQRLRRRCRKRRWGTSQARARARCSQTCGR